MPIKPENRSRYPANWTEIRAAILERAGHRCEYRDLHGYRCRAQQYAVGHWRESVLWRLPQGFDHLQRRDRQWTPLEGNRPLSTAADNQFWNAGEGRGAYSEHWSHKEATAFVARYWDRHDEDRPTIVVLTIAHLDHQPENCTPENLRALCQRHHLAHDHAHHRANAQATRRAKARTLEMF